MALKAWDHPAVVDLLDRLRYRSTREASGRITLAYANLVEGMIADAANSESIKYKVMVADTTIKFLKLVSAEDQDERKTRTRGVLADALKRAGEGDKQGAEEQTPEAIREYVRKMRAVVGEEVFQRMLTGE